MYAIVNILPTFAGRCVTNHIWTSRTKQEFNLKYGFSKKKKSFLRFSKDRAGPCRFCRGGKDDRPNPIWHCISCKFKTGNDDCFSRKGRPGNLLVIRTKITYSCHIQKHWNIPYSISGS